VEVKQPMELVTWLTVRQAAQQLGIARLTCYQLIKLGRVRAVQTPLGLLVDPASVERYAATRRPVRHKGEKVAVPA
jgi:excisionase family DNA binding protein